MSTQGPERAGKPQYFDDPALDALYQMVLVLGEEIAALREQVDTMLALHDAGKVPTGGEMDGHDLGEAYDTVRKRFVERLLEPLQDLADDETEA